MKAGLRLGPFELEAPIAAGGMGQVWAARHRAIGLPVAIKVLPGRISDRGKAALWAEARAVARIDHPHVIRLLDLGEVTLDGAPEPTGDPQATETAETAWGATAYAAAIEARDPGGAPFLVMERADGTLADRLPLAPEAALRALRDVLSALAAAHARGIVHRDVKPANVLRIGARWVLADFGVAAVVDGVVGARSGTPLYMAPEQIVGDGAAQGPWTDLYAVGCLAHALLTGRPPFPGPGRDAIIDGHRFGRPPPLPEALPAALRAWVDRLLAKDPARRYRCAADALSALDGGPAPVVFHDGWQSEPGEPPFPLIGAGLGLYAHRSVPLVGRTAEREALWSLLGAVHRTGDMRVAVLTGDPGVGTSRLARWLVERAGESGLAWPVTQAGDAPLGRAVRRAMNLDDVGEDDLRTTIARALDGAEPTAAEVHAIERLVIDRVAGEQAARGRAAIMAQWLGLWSMARPLIWWIDDAHFAEDALRALAQCLKVDDGAGLPILAVLTARAPDAQGTATADSESVTRQATARVLRALTQRPETLTLRLGPLTALDARRLIRALLHLDGSVADALERRAAGHPGFAVGWVADRITRGALVPGRDGFRPASGAALDVPFDNAAVWRQRAMALAVEPGERRLLELAAALGPTVPDAVWRRAGGDGPTTERLAQRLARSGLVQPLPERPDHWRFTSGPLAETIAAESRRAERWAAVNRAAAAALDGIDSDAAPDPALRARLLLRGGQPAQAIEPLLAAARQAIDRGAYGTGIAWLDERAALLEGPDPDGAMADWLRIRALRKLQRPEEALVIAEALWADPPADPALHARILIDSSALLRQRGRLAESRALTRIGLERARETGDRSLISAAASTLTRQLTFASLYDEAEPVIAEALETAADEMDRGAALYGVGLLACRRRQWPRARRALLDCIDAWSAVGHVHGASDAENQLADVARGAGDLAAAAEHYRRAIELARLAGISIAVPLLNQGALALELEQPEEARRLLRQAASALLHEGNALGAAFARVCRLQAAAMLSDAEEWAAALAMPPQPAAAGWGEMLTMCDETIELAQAVGFDPAPVHAIRARWAEAE